MKTRGRDDGKTPKTDPERKSHTMLPLNVAVAAFVYIEPSRSESLTEEQRWEDAGIYTVVELAASDILLERESSGEQFWFSRSHSRIRLGR